MAYLRLVLILPTLIAIHNQIITANAALNISVCYGNVANNLPPAINVINLYQKYNIGKLRLFDPNPDALNALRGKQIEVTVGVRNENVPIIAASQEGANSWFATNVEPYLNDVLFTCISVGNEIIPGQFGVNVLDAMQNIQNILNRRNLTVIKVSTVLAGVTLATSYPPSTGAFTPEASNILGGVLKFLSSQKSLLLINVYPYFAYAAEPLNVRLDYAQFASPASVVQDGSLSYTNLFDAIVDAFYSAMEKLGVSDVDVVVSETGWPSAGNGNFTSPELAAAYNQNFLVHTLSIKGTPKRPEKSIDGFLLAIFNENLKAPGVEQNFGLSSQTCSLFILFLHNSV